MSLSVDLKRKFYLTLDPNTINQAQKKKRVNFEGRCITVFSVLPKDVILRIISELSLEVIRKLALTCPYNYILCETSVATLRKNELTDFVHTFSQYTQENTEFFEIQEKLKNLSCDLLNIPKIRSIQFEVVEFFSSFVSSEILKNAKNFLVKNSKLYEWVWIMREIKNSMGLITPNPSDAIIEVTTNDGVIDEVENNEAAEPVKILLFKAAVGFGAKETGLLIEWYLDTCYVKIQSKIKIYADEATPIRPPQPPIFPLSKSLLIITPADKDLKHFFFELTIKEHFSILAELFEELTDFLLEHPLLVKEGSYSLPSCLARFLYSSKIIGREALNHVYLYLKNHSLELNSKALDIFNMATQIAELLYCLDQEDFQIHLNNCILSAKQISLNSPELKDRMIKYIILNILLPTDGIEQCLTLNDLYTLADEVKTTEIKTKIINKLDTLKQVSIS